MMLKNGADGNGPMPGIQSMDTAIQESDVLVGIEDAWMQILLLNPKLGEIGIMRVRVTANKSDQINFCENLCGSRVPFLCERPMERGFY